MAENGQNCWNWLGMDGNGWNHWKWLKMAEMAEMAGHDSKLFKISGMAGND